MSVLSDRDIKKRLEWLGGLHIDPLGDGQIQPASVDLRLGSEVRVFQDIPQNTPRPILDVDEVDNGPSVVERLGPGPDYPGELDYVLLPGQFILAATYEKITVPDDLVGRLEGKSSLGRLGLLVHSTAGYVDPGWSGDLTLELTNVSTFPIRLRYKMLICQISFITLSSPAERVYSSPELKSKYQGGGGAVASRPTIINN